MKLIISERIAVLAILNAFKGNLETMATILEDIKQIPVTEVEWKKANKKETVIGNNTQWNWDDAKGGDKEINLQAPTVEYLKTTIKGKSEKGEITFQDKGLLTLD